jgi:nucleoside-diphosphate-sugar epimerase
LVILGAGYTGRYLYDLETAKGLPVLVTSRAPEERLADFPPSHRIRFNLEQPETWRNIPSGSRLVWCFPAVPEGLVAAFAEQAAPNADRLIVLGSTSAYQPLPEPTGSEARPGLGSAPNGLIDESWPINLELPRVRSEEYLRLRHQAIVLRVAGLYGPGRNVLDWIRCRRVGPSPRYVNLVHVEDLALVCLQALESARPGEVYNVSDGIPRRWADICEAARDRWGVMTPEATAAASSDHRRGKRISIAKLRTELGYTFRHPDLYAALDALESAPIRQGQSIRG